MSSMGVTGNMKKEKGGHEKRERMAKDMDCKTVRLKKKKARQG